MLSAPREDARAVPPPGAGRDRVRSVCLYTPSADPSGMGAHLLDLAAEQVAAGADVSVMAWPTEPGRRLLTRAAASGARALALPHPRDPRFGDRRCRPLPHLPPCGRKGPAAWRSP